ncbi:MAG: sugar phosphate isomerase/epimerase, partial [Planctomycetota bacterium]
YKTVFLSCSADQLAPSAEAYRKHGIAIGAVYVGATVSEDSVAYSIPLQSVFEVLDGRGMILVHVGAAKGAQVSDDRLVAVLRELATEAAEHNVGVAIYPHVGNRLPTVESALAIAEAVDHPNLGVCLNLCHYLKQHPPQGIFDAARKARPLLKMVTINGADTGDTQSMGWDRLIQPLGQGSFDVAGFVRFVEHDLNFDGPVYVQLYNVKTPAESLIASTMAAWKAMHEPAAKR